MLSLDLTLKDSSTKNGEAYFSLSSENIMVTENGEFVFIDPI